MCRSEVCSASHIIFAYRLEGRGGKITENFHSDRDWGTGHELIKMMKTNEIVNTLIIATHTHSIDSVQLERKRFQHINDLCLLAYKQL